MLSKTGKPYRFSPTFQVARGMDAHSDSPRKDSPQLNTYGHKLSMEQ
jgi:hypothetical protein